MEEPVPIAGSVPSLGYMPAAPAFRGSRGGLVAWGVVFLLIGGLAALVAALIPVMAVFLLRSSPALQGGAVVDLRGFVVGGLMYLVVAVTFIWTGIGAIRARRWVRPIVMIIGWTWLLTGILALLQLMTALPSAFVGATERTVLIIIVVVTLVLMVVLPTVLLIYFHRPELVRTLNHFDPGPGWTDRCPTAVLGLSLGMWLGAVFTLAGLAYNVMPLFGIYLTGPAGGAALVAVAGLLALAGWTTYALRPAGWWLSLLLLVALPLSTMVTSYRLGAMAVYEHMGLSAPELEAMRAQALQQGALMNVLMAVLLAGGVAYMLWIRRHFRAGRV